MGSLSASGIPVVAKQPLTFRKRDNFITQTDNRTDTVSGLVTYKPDQNRAIGSGSIVRDSGVATYWEEVVVGVYRMGRSSPYRIASSGTDRSVVVNLAGNQTTVVLPSGSGTVSSMHVGERVKRSDSVTDTILDIVSNSGTP